jgi:glycosyltransferase involved in cell wall biosynthesis
MNILMLGRWVPPPRRPVRAMREYRFAQQLRARSHRLTLAFVTDNPDTAGPISTLRSEFGDLEFAAVPRAWKSLTGAVSLATGESCTLSYFRSEALRTRLGERMRRSPYDVVCVLSSSMIQYALAIDKTVPLVVDFAEVDSEWWLQRAVRGSFPSIRFFRTEAARLRAAEATAACRAARCVAASPEAAEIVKRFAAEAPMAVVPNGVEVANASAPVSRSKIPTVVLNTSLAGEMEVRDAIEFHRSVMPLVRERVPGARLVVVSREPAGTPPLGSALAGAEIAASVADPVPVLHQATVAVAPLRQGRDIQKSVLEPMAAGLAVIATPGARQRLQGASGEELVVADEPRDFARKIVHLLGDGGARAELASRGQGFVTEHYSWSHMALQFVQLVEAVKQPTGSPSRPVTEPLARAQL